MKNMFSMILFAAASLVGPLADDRTILCMADDRGWGDTGYNGHPVLKTPVMDGEREPVCGRRRGGSRLLADAQA